MSDNKDTTLNAWDFVEKYYPNYEASQEILQNNILNKIHNHELNGEAFNLFMEECKNSGLPYSFDPAEQIFDSDDKRIAKYDSRLYGVVFAKFLNLLYKSDAEIFRMAVYNFQQQTKSDYLETHYEVVTAIELLECENDERLIKYLADKGTGGKWQLAQAITDAFQQQYEDQDWEGQNTTWFEAIEEFVYARVCDLVK